MSLTYSRNSWPYKNIVISFFNSSRSVHQGAEVEEKRRGMGCVCEGTGRSGMDGGREAPQWQTVPLSAGCNDSKLPLVDVEVSEVVEGCTQGPARLHVVHLFG